MIIPSLRSTLLRRNPFRSPAPQLRHLPDSNYAAFSRIRPASTPNLFAFGLQPAFNYLAALPCESAQASPESYPFDLNTLLGKYGVRSGKGRTTGWRSRAQTGAPATSGY